MMSEMLCNLEMSIRLPMILLKIAELALNNNHSLTHDLIQPMEIYIQSLIEY